MSIRTDMTAAFTLPAAATTMEPGDPAGNSGGDVEELTALFRLLADKTRLNNLMLLGEGERNVSSLCDELRLPQPTVSHHLGLLRESNIIANRRDGKQVFYALHDRVHVGSGVRIGMDNYSVQIVSKLDMPV